MGGRCSKHGRDQKRIKILVRIPERKRMGDLVIDGRIVLIRLSSSPSHEFRPVNDSFQTHQYIRLVVSSEIAQVLFGWSRIFSILLISFKHFVSTVHTSDWVLLTYLPTHSLTPWCRIVLEKLIVTQLVEQ
jgi:hypothetical protein